MIGNGMPDNGSREDRGEPRFRWAHIMRLAYPGVGVKRWLLVGGMGIAVSSIGVAFLLRKLFALRFPNFLPSYFEGVLLVAGGIVVILLAIYGLYRSVGPLILRQSTLDNLAEAIYVRRSRGRGPRIVALGGGTGLSVLLRGLKAHTENLTAIITVADDGGSSGRLRRELDVLPPGDFRNCLVALSEAESLFQELFQYRFDQGNGLKGHSFGNLFIVAMNAVTNSFEQALHESSRVLAVRGRIVPATVANLKLSARLKDGTEVHGESHITERGGEVEQLFIDPSDAKASPLAVEAIQASQVIVIGPGSLYTSVLPNLLVSGIAEAIRESSAVKLYVCNVATEKGETEGYSVADHIEALWRHTFPSIVDFVLANNNPEPTAPRFLGQPVVNGGLRLRHAELERADLVDTEHPVRHDSTKLARAVMDLYERSRRRKKPSKTTVKP